MIISFIIPVYNTAIYIEKCIASILSQPVAQDYYEIIVVNDGSTDNSDEILSQIVAKYKNIQVFSQNNRGPGAARNTGLKHAQGEYIFFLDSDDYLCPSTLNKLIEDVNIKQSQIVGFDRVEVYGSGKQVIFKRHNSEYSLKTSGAEYMKNYNLSGNVCYLFANSLIKKYNIKVPENIYHEDDLFCTKAFLVAESVSFSNLVVYAYYQRENSTMNKKDTSFFQKRIDDFLFIISDLLNIKKRGSLSEIQKAGLSRKIHFETVDILLTLMRLRVDRKIIQASVSELSRLGVYPLPEQKYSKKYSLFRLVFNHEKMIILVAKFRYLNKFIT